MDAIEMPVYLIKGRLYFTNTCVYRIYGGFSQFLSKYLTDILQIRLCYLREGWGPGDRIGDSKS